MALDNFRTIGLIWDKANKSIIKTIKTASSDTTGRYFSVKVLDEGQEVVLTGAKLQLYWEHPNFNTTGTDDFTTVDTKGLFKLTFSDEMLTNIGELNAHLVLTLPDGKITSDGFAIEVIKGADNGVVVPTNGSGLVKQIDGKIDKGNVTLNDLTQEVKLALTGGSVAVVGVNAVGTENVKDGAVNTPKIADGAITPNKTSFLSATQKHNLFNPLDIGVGGYYRWQDGILKIDEKYSYSGTIPVELNKKYEMRDVANVTFWEGDKETFVSGVASTTTFTVTNPKIKYARLAYLTSTKNRVILSTFGHAVDKYKVGNQLLIDSDSVHELEPTSLKHIEVTNKHNLFNRNDVANGEYHNYTTGEIITNATMSRSGTIPVEIGKTYYLSAVHSMTYWEGDKKTFVSGFVSGGAYAPSVTIRNERIKYIKLNYNTSNRDRVVITSYPSAQTELYKLSDKFLIEPSDIFGIEEYLDATQPLENESRELLKPYNKVNNPIITKDIVTDRNAYGVADPFIVNDKGRFHMFFEVLSDTSEEIGHAFSDDLINWQYTQIVLSKAETGHRSAYPNVFKVDEKWYMIPDTAGEGHVNLYEALEFPLSWQFVTRLIDTSSTLTKTIVDTNVFKMGGAWYMTTTGGEDGWNKGVALYVNTSGDWKNNKWQKHPSGIIIPTDSENTAYRGAGNVKVFDGYVLLPIQATPTSSKVYGERVYLYKISNLSLTTANANRMGILVEATHNGSWNHKSMHHASWTKNGDDTIYAVDGQTSADEYAVGLYVDK